MLALIVWTLVMLVWLYALRIPAMREAKIDARRMKGKETHGLLASIPPRVHWPADNYNHLNEQPTLFYALMLYSYLAGVADDLNVWLAWTYVGLRVAHSIVQATTNFVPVRFLLFALSSIVLGVIAVRNVIELLAG
jgi:hypothetical protein